MMNDVLAAVGGSVAAPAAAPASSGVVALERWFPALQAAFGPPAPPTEAVRALLALSQVMTLPKGAQLLSRAQLAQRHWLLLTGQVAMGLAEQGRMRQQTREVLPGQWIDNASPWLGEDAAYLEDALVERNATVLSFTHADLLHCGARYPALLGGSAAALVLRVRDMLEAEWSLIRQSAESRFAAWLLQHAEPVLPGSAGAAATGRVVLRQRKRAIASQLGARPETFSRVLRQLVARGALQVRGYTIELLDLDLLHRLAAEGTPQRPS